MQQNTPDEEALNIWCHEELMGKCWHKWELYDYGYCDGAKCTKCNYDLENEWSICNAEEFTAPPEYTKSLDAARLVTEKVARHNLERPYIEKLGLITGASFLSDLEMMHWKYVSATPLQICQAAKFAVENNK